ncbi:MAG: hypothetical protein ACYCPT_13990 [Acidimicrobiales bacterium]
MRITYEQPHVSIRMRVRNIQFSHIEMALADPQVEYPVEYKGGATHIRVRDIEGRQFKVYFSQPASDHIHVWTVAVRGE